ncbi:MAG: nucleotidyltransferase domain-containing protein [Deltaproteobacteria bacterium]|nr:nucleotidyltransferase domain-containing protein [Deltaproteobacteria bacterium]
MKGACHGRGEGPGGRPDPGGNRPAAGGGLRRLVAAFQPERIYLYGSRARGEAGPDSDYDLMLVVSASQMPRYRRDQEAFRVLCGLGVPKEVMVLTRAEFDAGRQVVCSLPATVLREGKLLYAA